LQDINKRRQGLCVSITHQSILAVGTPIPGGLAVRNQMKKQPIGHPGLLGLGEGLSTLPCKTYIVSNPTKNWGGHDLNRERWNNAL